MESGYKLGKNENENLKIDDISSVDINMYLDKEISKEFALREKNDTESHSVISRTIDNVVSKLFIDRQIKIANLGAGANPQKYENILEKVKNGSNLDWVDISPGMLEVASESIDVSTSERINFIKNDFIGYLNSQPDETLDCVIMQYAINYIDNLEIFSQILFKKLKKGGAFVANLGSKSLENNQEASFLINGEEFKGRQTLNTGDRYTIRFLNKDGTIFASTEKNFFSNEEILKISSSLGFDPKIESINGFEMVILKK